MREEVVPPGDGHIQSSSKDTIACSGRIYDIDSDLDILNEIPTAVWISNFEEPDTRFVWANLAALRLWNKPSLSAFTSTDIMTGRSIAVKKVHCDLYQKVQVRKNSIISYLHHGQ